MSEHLPPGYGHLRVLVAEDHGLMLEAILNRLQSDPEVEVVGAVDNGEALVDAYATLHAAGSAPDLVLCDHSMPSLNGTQATERILALDPGAKVLMLSAHDDESLVVAAMSAGAVGYVLKSIPPAELREKARAAARGELVFDPRTAAAMIDAVRRRRRPLGTALTQGTPLSQREVEVLNLVSDGMTNAEVAEKLFISAHTVRTHLERICTKLGVSGRTAAVRKGIETGAIRPR
ncbi:MAG: response regulator [Acidimicrobiia bacterium]